MEDQDYANRRRFSRQPLSATVRVSSIDPEIEPGSGRSVFRTSQEASVDFSRGGLALRTQDPLIPGRRILIEFERPDGRNLEAVGRVAWTRLDPRRRGEQWIGVGVEFLGGDVAEIADLEFKATGRRRTG